MQFHPEVSPDMLAEWIKEVGDTPADLASFQHAVDEKAKALQNQADRLIENFLRAIAQRLSGRKRTYW